MIDFEIGKSYNFETYAPSLLGNNYKGVTILAKLDYDSASIYADLWARHQQLLAFLPPSTPKDPTEYLYVRVRFSNQETTVLGIPWVRLSTVAEVDSRTIIVKCKGMATSDAKRISDLLIANGVKEIEVSVQ